MRGSHVTSSLRLRMSEDALTKMIEDQYRKYAVNINSQIYNTKNLEIIVMSVM